MNFARKSSARFLLLTLVACVAFIGNANAKQSAPAKAPAKSSPSAKPKAVPAKATAPEIAIPIQIIPQPVSVAPGNGSFVFSAHTQIVAAAIPASARRTTSRLPSPCHRISISNRARARPKRRHTLARPHAKAPRPRRLSTGNYAHGNSHPRVRSSRNFLRRSIAAPIIACRFNAPHSGRRRSLGCSRRHN